MERKPQVHAALRCWVAAARVLVFAGLICVLISCPMQGQTLNTVYAFTNFTAGSSPRSAVTLDPSGDIYGTTQLGGPDSWGVVYKIDALGQETVLHGFGGLDGEQPMGRLIRDKAGNLYGTTNTGGTNNHGTVFVIRADGSFQTLHNFGASRNDGSAPRAGLLRDVAGNLYGTTQTGGDFKSGTVFKLDANGNETVIYSFTGGADGGAPQSDLVRDPAGVFYGTTSRGGAFGFGTVFKLDSAGNESVLYSFGAHPGDGVRPVAGLLLDVAGNLYGTASASVQSPYAGTVFKLDPAGVYTVLKDFNQNTADGAAPVSGLVQDANGNLYGVCSVGGSAQLGTAFMITSRGQFRLLVDFNGSNGSYPEGKLVLDGSGRLYGTTAGQGGTVFSLSR